MKLWLSKNGGISIKEQLTRQIILAIVGGDLRAGDRLPSVRELALRHKIHPNTAGAAYRLLEENGWVEPRVGSGVYVREVAPSKIEETTKTIQNELDRAISSFLEDAKRRGFGNRQIRSRLRFLLNVGTPKKIVIVENDADLRRILSAEISESFSVPVFPVENETDGFAKDSLVVSLADLSGKISAPAAFVKLKLNSVQDSMRGETKPGEADLIGIASHWEMFRSWSQTMLVAVGIGEENLVVRDADEKDWQNGLSSCKLVVADSLTAKHLRNLSNVKVFRLISADSIREMQNLLT
jgi:GntR family transcriptional regulator